MGIGALPAIALSTLLFVPYYWRSGVYTVPEFLGKRYNNLTRIVQIICWGTFMAFLTGQFFWASSLMLEEYLGNPILVGLLLTGWYICCIYQGEIAVSIITAALNKQLLT